MKQVFLLGGAEVAFLLAKGLVAENAAPVFVANGLAEKTLAPLGPSISLEELPLKLSENPQSTLMILTRDIEQTLLDECAQIAKAYAITMLPSVTSWQRLKQEPVLMQCLGCEPSEYVSSDVLVQQAQYLPYPLLVQGPILDPNNFYQVIRKPKQLAWALDNAKALSVTDFRLSTYQEVKRSFLLQASYQKGFLVKPSIIGVNSEHGLLHEAWQGEPLPDHWFIKASAKLAELAFMLAPQGIISAYFDVVNDNIVLRSFAPWPVLAGWVDHAKPANVFQQQIQLLLQQPLLPNNSAMLIKASALKLQAVNSKAKPQPLLQFDFATQLLFYQQSGDVREAVRDVIVAANKACL